MALRTSHVFILAVRNFGAGNPKQVTRCGGKIDKMAAKRNREEVKES
jgi:hypothetical protein